MFTRPLFALALLGMGVGVLGSGPALAVPSVPQSCLAGCVPYAGSSGDLKAEVYFEQSGTDLLVTLVNTADTGVSVPTDVLTGVYFTLMDGANLITLTPLTAYVADRTNDVDFPNPPDARLANADGTTFDATQFTDGNGINVGGEFAYAGGDTVNFQGAKSGISSSGLGIFGDGNFCSNGCPDIAPPDASVDGLQLGIVPFAGFSSPNGGVKGDPPYVQSAVQFKLSGLPTGFTLTAGALSNVGFQYGTSLSDPHFNAPAPATLALLGLGFVLLGGFRARRRPS